MAEERDVPGWTRSEEHAPRVLGVAELNRIARADLEERYPDVWVEGELADVRAHSSGHLYFTLCDPAAPAQVRGVMYRSDAARARARMENGARVRLRCSLSLYEARGEFRITARVALPAGAGDRAAEVARVRKRLAEDGLLDPARKRRLPRVPRTIALVTSRDGAAIHDFVRVAQARMPVRIVLVHCQVQGEGAARSIVRALRGAHRVPGVEAIVIARGGGASEDLSAFDDEEVARAVAKCLYPTISGIGHEIDVTLVDLVADVRAATPSNAAELLVPERARLFAEIESLSRALERALEQRVDRGRLRIERVVQRLGDPRRRLVAPRQRLGALAITTSRVIVRRIADGRREVERLRARLAAAEPRARLARDRARLRTLEDRARRAIEALLERGRASLEARDRRIGASGARIVPGRQGELARLDRDVRGAGASICRAARAELARLASTLEALSPLGILARGYAIALTDGQALIRARDVRPGALLEVRLHEGSIAARVERVEEDG